MRDFRFVQGNTSVAVKTPQLYRIIIKYYMYFSKRHWKNVMVNSTYWQRLRIIICTNF